MRREVRSKNGKTLSRFEIGNKDDLIKIRELSNRLKISLHIFIVQPGVSKSVVSQQQLELLSVTENYLMETRMFPFTAIISI